MAEKKIISYYRACKLVWIRVVRDSAAAQSIEKKKKLNERSPPDILREIWKHPAWNGNFQCLWCFSTKKKVKWSHWTFLKLHLLLFPQTLLIAHISYVIETSIQHVNVHCRFYIFQFLSQLASKLVMMSQNLKPRLKVRMKKKCLLCLLVFLLQLHFNSTITYLNTYLVNTL